MIFLNHILLSFFFTFAILTFKFNKMKKFLIVLVFLSAAFVGRAQLFVGGSLGASFSGGKSNEVVVSEMFPDLNQDNVSYGARTSSFVFSPTVGFMASDKIGFGLNLTYSTDIEKECTNDALKDFNDKDVVSTFGFSPFFRFVFADFGKFKLYADAKLPFEFLGVRNVYEENNQKVKEKGPKGFDMAFYIQPAFTYQFNEHISFNAEVGLLSLGYSFNKLTYEYTEDYTETTYSDIHTSSYFGLGVNQRVPVQFGFVYTF